MLLEGRAENIYDSVPTEVRGDYEVLTALLMERLQPPRLLDLRSVELHARQQRSGEAVAEYARNIQVLTRQAYPEIDAVAQDQLMKRIFLNGFSASLRTYSIPVLCSATFRPLTKP